MDWLVALAYGAVGGSLVELLVTFGRLTDWQSDRRRARQAGRRRMPSVTKYFDPLADTLVAISRIVLGAGAGWVFHTQVTGAAAAIAVGACAPAFLRQVASVGSVRQAVSGPPVESAPDPMPRSAAPVSVEEP